MARRRRPEGERPRRRRRPPPPAGALPDFPDPRATEGELRQLVRSLEGEAGQDTPLDRAQALIYRAYEDDHEERRLQLAREALALCPDCADAYVLLAEHARSRKEALRLYEQGVAAGERALGPKVFEESVGHFWGILETRPYMRARQGLANSLWTAARREEAVQHLREMLRLNPGDNQGVRYTLAGFLLFLDRDDELAHLLEQYSDDGLASWAYTRALLAFRQHGDTPEARRLLQQALKKNEHIPAYLTGQKFPPPRQPTYYSAGDENEALEYLGSFLVGWKDTPGAVAWLRDVIKADTAQQAPHPRGPLGFIRKWLRERLAQEYDVWEADFRQIANWIRVGGEKVRPWVTLVTSRSSGLVLAHQVAVELPSAALLWDTLVEAMRSPAAGEPHRPTELRVRDDERWQSLAAHFEEIGVQLVVTEDLDQVEGLLAELAEHLGGKPQPGLLDVPGMKQEQVAGFYQAAASFFRQSPWKRVGYESAIRVECDRFQSGPWYAVLMGQSGLVRGLAVYEDLETLQRGWERPADPEENVRQSVATTVIFGEETDLPLADVEAARRYGWEVARPDAYPEAMHKERGLAHRPPLVWELELLEGCLRAVPEFVSRRRQDDPARETLTVPAAAGQLTLVLSWVAESGE